MEEAGEEDGDDDSDDDGAEDGFFKVCCQGQTAGANQ